MSGHFRGSRRFLVTNGHTASPVGHPSIKVIYYPAPTSAPAFQWDAADKNSLLVVLLAGMQSDG